MKTSLNEMKPMQIVLNTHINKCLYTLVTAPIIWRKIPCLVLFFSISLVSHGSQVRYFEMGFEFTYYITEWRDMQTAYSGLPLQTKTRVDFKST